MITVQALQDLDDPLEWDRQAIAAPGGSFNQTTLYAEYVRRTQAAKQPFLLRCTVGGETAARLLFFREGGGAISWKQGPLLTGPEESVRKASSEIAAWIGGSGIRASTTPTLHEWQRSAQIDEFCAALRSVGATLSLAGTFHVRLDEHFMSRMDRCVAKNVRRCTEHGVSVTTTRELLDAGWDAGRIAAAYAGLIAETTLRNGASDRDAIEAASVILEQDLSGRSLTFFGFAGEQPLAALNVAVTGGMASERKQAYSALCRERGLHVNDAVKVAALEWARRQGLAVFDLMGVRLRRTPEATGIARYKKKFGGDFLPCIELNRPSPIHT